MDSRQELADLIFPNINETIEDLEKRFPERDLVEGAKVTRFAPSPTGFLHTGSLFTSMIASKIAYDTKGVFYTRLEDTDTKIIFQWVKDILDKDLPRPYFINAENEFNINEYEYYRNKGINLLYYSELDEELRKSMEENIREIENEIGKKTLRIC